jgi:hypothetical protein
MTRNTKFFLWGIGLALIAGLLPFPALAQTPTQWASKCTADGTLYGLFCNLGAQFRYMPQLLATLCYTGGAGLLLMALLNLKAYGDDPSSVPIRSVIMKLVLATFLISLPLAMQVFVGSVTGQKVEANMSFTTGERPCLMKSNLMRMRSGNGGAAPCS